VCVCVLQTERERSGVRVGGGILGVCVGGTLGVCVCVFCNNACVFVCACVCVCVRVRACPCQSVTKCECVYVCECVEREKESLCVRETFYADRLLEFD